MRNQTSFRLTTTLLPTDTTAKTTQVINKVDSDGNKFYPSFTEETVVLTNDDRTIMETTKATCTNWVLTFVKRGLSDDSSETQVANRKLTWNPWTICFITAWAWDWIDIDDNLTWTGKQTYTGDLESQGKATYKGQLITEKWVKYPNFEDTTALEAYADPFGWMFATVDNTWELYRYNAVTEQRDLVSTADLWTYTIRSDTTPPEEWTADTIITLLPNSSKIYLGENLLVNSTKYADILLAGWGGYGYCAGWGWGWVYLWERVWLWSQSSFCISVWAAGSWEWCSGCPTSMEWIRTVTWGASQCVYNWWASGRNWLSLNIHSWGVGEGTCCRGYGWGWWAVGAWGRWIWASGASCTVWWNWWEWVISDITGCVGYYGYGGAGSSHNGCWTQGYTCVWYGVGWYRSTSACQWVAIIRYPSDWSYWISCATGGTVTTCNWYTIHTFTCNGTFTIVS